MSAKTPQRHSGIKGKVKRFVSSFRKPAAQPSPPTTAEGATLYQQMIPTDVKLVDGDLSLLDRLKSSAQVGLGTFKVVLKIAASSSDWNPIVKSVLGGVVALLDHFGVRYSHLFTYPTS